MRNLGLAVVLLLLLSAGAARPVGHEDASPDAPEPGPDAKARAAAVPEGPAEQGPTVWIAQPSDTLAGLVAALEEAGLRHNVLPSLGMATFLGDAHDAAALREDGHHVEPNEKLDLHLDRSVEYIEADAVKRAVGLVRDGPVVLVVDTGIDSAHPDFRETMVANIQPEVEGGLVVGDLSQQPVVDPAGHGTHVGGIVAGTGAGIGDGTSGRYQGVFSNGRVASYQVTLDTAGSQDPQVDTAAALQAFEWALSNRDRFDLQVVTNSWGAPGPFDPQAAVNQATLRLYESGMVVVFSAGNEGRDGGDTLNKYCMAPWVLCVAAGDFGGARASFSSMGSDDAPYKHPDLTAPGSQITSAHPLSGVGGNLRIGQQPGQSLYSERSGTSMAAPHVAAVAGLLLAANPDLSPDQVMDILVSTTDPMADDLVRVGTGYLNARTAYNLALSTTGTRDAFLEGQIKYGGPATGDREYQYDPVSVGYDGTASGAVFLPAPQEPVWILESIVAWVLGGLVLLTVVSGVQWRRPRERYPAAGHASGAGIRASARPVEQPGGGTGGPKPASTHGSAARAPIPHGVYREAPPPDKPPRGVGSGRS